MLFAQSIVEYGALEKVVASLDKLWDSFNAWLWESPRELWFTVFGVAIVALWFWFRPKKF